MSQPPDDDYPIELSPPDISAWRDGNTGIPYMTTLASGSPGPHAMILALTHGNEICGAIALAFLFTSGFRPALGKVTLGFANVAAYQRFDRRDPNASRFVDEDFNRVWDAATLDGTRQSSELARARRIRPLVDTVDILLDIHSMTHSTEALALAGSEDKGVALAKRIGIPRLIVRDEGHAAGRRLRDYGKFADPAAAQNAVLVECGQHWEQRSADVARDSALRFLDALGMLEPEYRVRHVSQKKAASPQQVIQVTDAITIETDAFRFVRDFHGLEVIPNAGTLIASDGTRELRTPYPNCVLIMPSRKLIRGQTAVRLGRCV